MNRSIHFFAGSLAAIAVTSGVTLAGPSAYAADEPGRTCGQPAVPAVFGSVVHEPVLREVPPVTHDEWRWERAVTTFEHEFSRVVSAAYSETDWARDLPGSTEYRWSLKVIDREAAPAVAGTEEEGHFETVVVTPAVTETMIEYAQHKNGNTRWMPPGWNASDIETQGWFRTGNVREDVVTPAVTEQKWVVDKEAVEGTAAVDEVSHLEYTWAVSSPGADWTGPLASQTVGGGVETATTIGAAAPAGDGWTQTAVHQHDEVVDTVWALEAPAGYGPTGATRPHDVSIEQTDVASAQAPEGDGWTQVADSRVVVVDQEATTEIVSPGTIEQVQLSPEQPATEPCLAAAPSGAAVVTASAAATGSAYDGSGTVAAVSHANAHVAEEAATVLPAAGNPVSPLLLTAGLGSLLAGGVLVGIGRRRRTS